MTEWSGFQGELIVLVAPRTDDAYYASVGNDIFQFQIDFAETIAASGDAFIIIADEIAAVRYEAELSAEAFNSGYVLQGDVGDIWARDFSPAFPDSLVKFRYTAAGQAGSQSEADDVQRNFTRILWQAGVRFSDIPVKCDGGNVVEDGDGNAVISTKFLSDNFMTLEHARHALYEDAGLNNVAFIEADEQGGLEHSDGVVSFVEAGVLAVNDYVKDPDYQTMIEDEIYAAIPNVTIHRVIMGPQNSSEILDDRFGSACGLYTNALVTPDRIFLPQFGVEEDDIAYEQFSNITSKEVIRVSSSNVCNMVSSTQPYSINHLIYPLTKFYLSGRWCSMHELPDPRNCGANFARLRSLSLNAAFERQVVNFRSIHRLASFKPKSPVNPFLQSRRIHQLAYSESFLITNLRKKMKYVNNHGNCIK